MQSVVHMKIYRTATLHANHFNLPDPNFTQVGGGLLGHEAVWSYMYITA
jgi:hypothetical protein